MYFPPEITKEFVLSKVSEEEIFERYGVPVVNYSFCNPLRIDDSPTCTFYRSRANNKLYMRDWAGYFWGDCFDLVIQQFNVNFYQALEKIAKDFGLIKSSGEQITRVPAPPKVKKAKDYPELRVKRRSWTDEDRKFWGRWDFKRETINLFKVFPAERIWMDRRQVYVYRQDDPAYIYHFGGYDYKIYFPLRDKNRFLHGNPFILQGFLQLPEEGDVLLITKSYKDVMKLYEFGIWSVSPMSEAQIPTEDQYTNLKSRFNYIFSLYDCDRRGVLSMQQMKRKFGIKPLFFPRSFPTKDFTDFYEAFGQEDTDILVRGTKDQFLD